MSSGFRSTGKAGEGYYEERRWSGGDASAAEKAAGIYRPHGYSLNVLRINSPRVKAQGPYDRKPFEHWAHKVRPPGNELRASIWNSRNLQNALISELYAKVKGGDFNATVATAQLDDSLRSIANAASRIYRAYRYARRGRLRDAAIALTGANKNRLSNKAATKEMANNWLELQYGWLPLLGDVHSATELLANYLHRPYTQRFRVRRQMKTFHSNLPYSGYTYGKVLVRQRAQIVAYIEEKLPGHEILGLTDPYTLAWELLPYSFVIDWFLPIGPWLEARAAARALKGTFITTRTNLFVVEGLLSGRVKVQGGESYRYESFEMVRDVSKALSAVMPAFQPLEKVASLGRCLNALALLESLRR